MIPKQIMQTWKNLEIPTHWKSSQSSILNKLPDWKYVLLTDVDNEAFVQKHFPGLLYWYQHLKYPIQRADVIRYMWLYVNGGVYIDLDIEIIESFEELFENQNMDTWLLRAPRNLANHYTNFFMASTAKNPFWLKVLEECIKPLSFWVILPHHVISHQTGLAALSRAANKWTKPIALLPDITLIPCDYCNPDDCSKPFFYFKFLRGQSWNNADTRIFNAIICNIELFVLIFVGFIIYSLLKKSKI